MKSNRQVYRRALALLALIGALALLAGCGLPGTIPSGGQLQHTAPVATPASLPPVQFPQDEAPHHDLTEWWYYTGHVHGVDAQGQTHEYGFELTFFQTLRGGFSPYYAAHFAITDITGNAFHFDQRAGFEPASVIPAPGSRAGFNVALGGWSARGLNGHDYLIANMTNYAIAFHLAASKPAALHGGNGLITYGAAGFSYYYSQTRMALAGTLTDHGVTISVTGQAWMDHQWGNFVSLTGSGWDWYSIQLDNNTEYMLYVIRDSQKRRVATFGTFVASDGSTQEIAPADISTQALSSWTSPSTGAVYPSGWHVTIASQQLDLTVMPQVLDQELVTTQSTGVAYWEGAVRINGTLGVAPITGLGYVELTGYANLSSTSQGALP